VLALGILVTICGLMINWAVIVVGGLWTLWGMYKFAMEYHRPDAEHAH
jgi:hypothetical protein